MDRTLQQLLQSLMDITFENQELKKANKGMADTIMKLMKEKEEAAKAAQSLAEEK